VEKAVENVEKFRFSTGKRRVSNIQRWFGVYISLHNRPHNGKENELRHRPEKETISFFKPKKFRKNKSHTHFGRLDSGMCKKLCEKPPKFFAYHLLHCGNNGSTQKSESGGRR
jgi:hypothetical protein